MPAVQASKAWSINPNVRNAFVSLADMAGWWIYENHAYLITKNWTVKLTSNGVLANASDNLPNKTAASVRGAAAGNAQSFTVLTNPDGVDLLITYQGATDDIIRISYSPGGLYVANTTAGTGDSFAFGGGIVTLTDAAALFTAAHVGRQITIAGATSPGNNGNFVIASFIDASNITYANASGVTEAFTGTWTITNPFQPTATDEVIIAALSSIINAGASADRVMTIWASDDGKAWSNVLFRTATMQSVLGLERIFSACDTSVLAKPYFGYRYNALDRAMTISGATGGPTYNISSAAVGTANFFGGFARVFTAGATRITRLGAGSVAVCPTAGNSLQTEEVFTSNNPALNAGMPLLPLFLTGEKSTNLDGFLGVPMDWWCGYSASLSVPNQNDFFPGFDPGDVPGVSGGQTGVGDPRTNWFIALGSTMVRPWRNAAASMQTS